MHPHSATGSEVGSGSRFPFAWRLQFDLRLMVATIVPALLGCLLAGASLAQAPEPLAPQGESCRIESRNDGETLQYCGVLDHRFEAFVRQNLNDRTRTLEVTSTGGRIPNTITAARMLYKRNVEIVAKDYCLSACAQFLFIPAPHGRLEKGTLIALHQTDTVLGMIRIREGWADSERLRESVQSGIALEAAFYKERGLRPELLVDPFRAIRPRCVVEAIAWETPVGSDRTPVVDFRAEALWWMPSKRTLEWYGMPAKTGEWPMTIQDISEMGQKSRAFGDSGLGDQSSESGSHGGATWLASQVLSHAAAA